MKVIVRKKSKTVQAATASAFDKRFEKVSEEMDDNVELVWDAAPMCVHFIYEETVKIPETLAEQFELDGLQRYCKDCPHFIPGKNRSYRGQGCSLVDNRVEYSPACELFYHEVVDGKIKLMPEVEGKKRRKR